MTNDTADSKRSLLRHAVATLAYRGAKAARGAPAGFEDFRGGSDSRTPGQILAHVGDLLDWALSMARGREAWKNAKPLPWDRETARFHEALARFDDALSSSEALAVTEEQLFQGPIADALTHVGQIAMLRRMAGAPIRGENYFRADIAAGRVGAQQAASNVEFD
jgi:hypothetical protein